MGIYISNLKIPKDEYLPINIYPDGRVACRFDANCANAIEIPPHGRLIDADVLIDKVIAKYLKFEREGKLVFAAAEIKQDICDLISGAPTVIPAEEET